MNTIKFKKQPIYVIADIHGNLSRIYDIDIENCILFIAGDIGIGFKSYDNHFNDLYILNNYLSEKKINLLLIRGNHDDPNYFYKDKFNFSNIYFINDYSIITVDTKNILCIGGAISVDRIYRKKYMENQVKYQVSDFSKDKGLVSCYWEDEIPKYNEELLSDIINNGIIIDYVITHTSPSFCFKNNNDSIINFILNDKFLKDDLAKEREVLNKIYNFLINNNNTNIKKWIYGHFHFHNNEKINGIEFIALSNFDKNFDIIELNYN